MSSGYNVFDPEDLDLAQSILDEVWASLPGDIREGPRAGLLREQLARQVLAAMTKEHVSREELKASLMQTKNMADRSWQCDDAPISELSNSSERLPERRM